MYASSRDAYRNQAVQTASPAQLVLMLYDGVLAALVRARLADGQPGGLEIVNRELQRAQDILTELTVTLDHERGGQIAANLAALYDFCLDRLLSANLTKELQLLDDVEPVVRELREAWDLACCQGVTPAMAGG